MARTDFDFLFGDWSVRNRRLAVILAGSDDWYAFDATASARPLWGGLGNTDEFVALETPVGPVQGGAVRLLDPKTGLWRISWASAATGEIGAPVVGGFEAGVGTFYGHEVYRDRGVFVRYTWDSIEADSCRWHQAFSADAGASWETNWVMEFSLWVPA